MFSVDEAHNKVLKIERLQSRAFRLSTPIKESVSGAEVQPSFTMVDRPPARQSTNAPSSTPATTTTTVAKSKNNPYAKPGVGKCYRCESLDISLMNALKESMSIWQIMKMKKRNDLRLKN